MSELFDQISNTAEFSAFKPIATDLDQKLELGMANLCRAEKPSIKRFVEMDRAGIATQAERVQGKLQLVLKKLEDFIFDDETTYRLAS